MVRLEAELGRAYLMSGQADLALPVIEAALVRAEAATQLESIAQLLVSRAWAVTQAGRPTESLVLLRGVVEFCDEHQFLNARMRSAMNLSAWEMVGNPRRAMVVAQEGLAIARRRRLAGWAGAIAGNWAEGAFEVGEWDAILALVADLDAEGLLPADESAPIFVGVYMVRAYRGAVDEATDALERVLGPQMDDYQVARSFHDASCHLRFAAGDDEAMRRHAAELLGYREMYAYDAIPAARASLWLRDAAGIREALGERDVSRARATDLRFAVIRAGLAALDGRTDDARAAYLAAEAGLRDLGSASSWGSPCSSTPSSSRRTRPPAPRPRRHGRSSRSWGRPPCSRGCRPGFPPPRSETDPSRCHRRPQRCAGSSRWRRRYRGTRRVFRVGAGTRCATVCYMAGSNDRTSSSPASAYPPRGEHGPSPDATPARVGVRELRQNLSVYLRRVEAGETLEVTEHGHPVARLTPLPPQRMSVLDRMIAEGRAYPGKGGNLADWASRIDIGPGPTLSEVLQQMRDEDDR